jgi:hypothetical protein
MNRQDLKVLPNTQPHAQTAEALTKVVKTVNNQNLASRQLSRSFRHAAGIGIGWVEVAQNEDDLDGRNILIRSRNPFDIWTAPEMREPDLSDCRDLFRAMWLEPSRLALLFPQFEKEIHGLVGRREETERSHSRDYTNLNGDRPPVRKWGEDGFEFGGVDTNRNLVRAVERWYRLDQRAVVCKHRDGRAFEVTEQMIPEVAYYLAHNLATLRKSIIRRMRIAMFAGELLLQDAPSPYSHGEFPLTPLWAYEDEEGRPMGLVRQDREPQKEFSARRTSALKKALMRQLWHERGAFTDIDRAVAAAGQHDGEIEINPGYFEKVKLVNDLQSSQAEIQFAEQARMMVQDWAGVTRELAGQNSNATSGVAIQSRQSQGQASLFTLYDNRNWCQQRVGELTLALIQDTFTEEQTVRVTDSRKGLDFITLNQRGPGGIILNNVQQGKYDVTLTEVPIAPTDRSQQLTALTQYFQILPAAFQAALAPEVARLADLPNSEDLVAKLEQLVDRFVLGQTDPAAGGPTPEPDAPTLDAAAGTQITPQTGPLAPTL